MDFFLHTGLTKVKNIKNSDFKVDKFIDEKKKIKDVSRVLIEFDGYDKQMFDIDGEIFYAFAFYILAP